MNFANEFNDSLSGGACSMATMEFAGEQSGDSQEGLDGGASSTSSSPVSSSGSASEMDAVSAGGPPDWLVAAIEEDQRRSSAEYGLPGETQQDFDGGSATA